MNSNFFPVLVGLHYDTVPLIQKTRYSLPFKHFMSNKHLILRQAFGWMDARGHLTKTEEHSSSSELAGSVDMQFCFSPKCGVRSDYRKKTRTLHQKNGAAVL